MNSFPSLSVVLSGFVTQLPLVLVSLLGVIISIARWRDAPAASRWTLGSSLLSLFICVAAPFSQGLVLAFARSSGMGAAGIGMYYSGIGFFWAMLRAISVGLLLAGVYAGRGVTAATGPGTLPPPPGYLVNPNL